MQVDLYTLVLYSQPQTERTITVELNAQEAAEYAKMEKKALETYTAFQEANWKKFSKNHVKLIHMLLPLRIACAGGSIPQIEDAEVDEGATKPKKTTKRKKAAKGDEETAKPKKTTAKKKEQVFSEFSFRSKFAVLMDELKTIRDNEPNGTYVFVLCPFSDLQHWWHSHVRWFF